MAGGRASFEIQTCRDGRWSTEELRESESAARSVAKGIFGSRTYCEGVRIVKNWERADGLMTENVVFTEMRENGGEVRVNIVPVDEAPYCRRSSEYYRLESRITINRLFRKYLEKVYLTPTELIHNYSALRKVQEVDGLVPAAVDRVASIQAKLGEEDPRTRRDDIYKAVARMTQRARRVTDRRDLPKLKGTNLEETLDKVESIAPPDEAQYYSLVVLCNDLVQHRNWLGKLERLVALVPPEKRDDILAMLDGVLADLVGVPTALQDILGYQRNLAQALCAIADLCEGCFDNSRSDARDQLAVLNPLLAEGRLEETRRSLLNRLLRQLSSAQPLNRHDPAFEREALREVLNRLLRREGLLGDGEAAVALTRRYAHLGEEGGLTALRQSVGGICSMIADPLYRAIYLCELAGSALAADLMPEILTELYTLTRQPSIDGLAPPSWPPRDKMLLLTRLYNRVAAVATLPAVDRTKLLENIDRLLADYLKRARIIERLDDPAAPLRRRAIHLLEFCAAGVLPPEGKAQALARERVISLLKQPNFEAHLVEDIAEPAKCEEALRNFHALLVRGGFR